MKKVLMISMDRKIFDVDSEAYQRMCWYGTLFEELHIVVFAKHNQTIQIAKNVFAYSTNSRNKLWYIWDGYGVAERILKKDLSALWVISSQDPCETGLLGYFLRQQFQAPLQLQIHVDIFSSYFWKESLLNKIRVLLAKFLLPRANGIRVVSERIYNSLIAYRLLLASRIVVLPVFVEIEKIRATIIETNLHKKYSTHNFILLVASRLTREKNIGMAIDAMREVIPRYPKTLLVIVGDGPERKNLELQTINYRLQTNVVFEPWVSGLSSYYKTSDVFMLTSNYEGYGRTPIEALAAGCPVIMTDVGVAGEYVRHNESGLVVPIGDAHALAECILRLHEDQAQGNRLRDGGFQVVTKLPSKDEYSRRYQESIEKL